MTGLIHDLAGIVFRPFLWKYVIFFVSGLKQAFIRYHSLSSYTEIAVAARK
jgi:hypothetical protein